jgi:hypothetical protein
MRYILHVVAVAVLVPAVTSAQTAAMKTPVPHNQVLSTNPFGLIIKWVNGEYERRVLPAVTVGASASQFGEGDISDDGFATASGLVRWYPQGAALDGFYLGARLGAFRFKSYQYDYSSYTTGQASSPNRTSAVRPTVRERTMVVPGAGLEVGYNWLLGPKDNVSVGIGFGLTRTLGNNGGYELPDVLPTFRLINIGVAF